MHIHFKRNTAREVGTKRIWMGHEIISINLGEPSNISCTNGWAMKQIYLIFSLENRFKIKKSYLQVQLLIVFRIIQGLKSPLLEQPNHAEGGMDIQLYIYNLYSMWIPLLLGPVYMIPDGIPGHPGILGII